MRVFWVQSKICMDCLAFKEAALFYFFFRLSRRRDRKHNIKTHGINFQWKQSPH